MSSEGIPDVKVNSPRASKVKVAAFLALFLIATAAMILTGIWKRPAIQALGGKLHVIVENNSKDRLRVDLSVGPQVATIELTPGEKQTVRFSPVKTMPVEFEIFMYGKKMSSGQSSNYVPDHAYDVHLKLGSATAVEIETIDGNAGP